MGQMLWIAQITVVGSTTWPSVSDIGYLIWPVAASGQCSCTSARSSARPRASSWSTQWCWPIALSFVAWEVIIRAGVGDPAQLSLPAQLAMLIYPLTDIALASMLGLLILHGGRPRPVSGCVVGAVLLTVGDIAYPSTVGSTSSASYAVSFPGWALGLRRSPWQPACRAAATLPPTNGRVACWSCTCL